MQLKIYLFLNQCLIIFNQYQLINGEPIIGSNIRQTQTGDFPYIVSLMKIQINQPDLEGIHFCTGTLITRLDVLSCAHCFEDEVLNSVRVIVGTIDRRRGEVFHPFWWQTHDQWSTANNITITFGRNDLANLRLLKKVGSNILPVRLSRLSNTELYNARAVIAGWGINNQGVLPNIMNSATVQVIENHVCEVRLSRIVGPTSYMDPRILCTYVSPYTLIEYGDSGGPLLFRNRLIGVNKATCPADGVTDNESTMNLHMCIYFYSTFINFMKNE